MRKRSLQSRALFCLFILFLGLPLSCFAYDAGDKVAKDTRRLHLDLDLYFWPAGLEGDVTAESHTAHTNVKFGDIIHDLKMTGNGAFKIYKGDWFLFNDFIYLDLSHKASENIPAIPGASIDATLDTRVIMDMLVAGRQWQGRVPWNVFIGARYFYGKVKLDAMENLGPFSNEKVAERSEEWVTPTIGGGINFSFNNKLSLNIIGDVGVWDRSFSWEAVPTLCWKLNDMFTAEAGYRLLDIRHKEDGFKMDTLMHGPIVGMKVTF